MEGHEGMKLHAEGLAAASPRQVPRSVDLALFFFMVPWLSMASW